MSPRRAAIGALILVVMVLAALGGAQILMAGRDPTTIHDAVTLPERITVCGRTWTRDTLPRQLTLAEARSEKSGGNPSVVATGPFAPCPPGPCTDVATAVPCDTVVFVRVSQDAYVDYALAGGP